MSDSNIDDLLTVKERTSTSQTLHIADLGNEEGEAVVMEFTSNYYNH